MRSRSESLIAGVCGGIGEYFSVDPVIVRLIFILLGLTTWGVGLLIYGVLWLIMPRATEPDPLFADEAMLDAHAQLPQPGRAQPFEQQDADKPVYTEVRRAQPTVSQTRPPAPPRTLQPGSGFPEGEPVSPLPSEPPMTGETTVLQTIPPPAAEAAPEQTPARPRRRGALLGILLVGVGLAGAASAFNIPASLAFPLILIAVGVMMLRRK